MSSAIPVGIAGVGHHVPDWVLDNHYFETIVDTSDEWIQKRTGIVKRRWLPEGQRPSDMFVAAGQMALDRAGVAPEDVDLIIIGTVSGDYMAPSTACVVQQRLGLRHCGAFDVAAACTGFMYALATGTQFIASGKFRNVLVMGGEAISRMIDHTDRTTVVLFGDGAGAALLQPHSMCNQGLVEDVNLGADGSGYHFILRPRGGGFEPMTHQILDERSHFITMKGREVYRFAVAKMTEMLAWAIEGRDPEKLGYLIPHQMNKRILETATANLNIPAEKVLVNIEKYGNTSAASVPILMSEAYGAGKFEKGKYLVLAAFGAGLTWAGARILW